MAREITLTRGHVAIVDDADFYRLITWKWCSNGRYAMRREAGRSIFMHRQLLAAPAGMVPDHISGDTFDNRRDNLRLCTHAQNMRNRRSKGGSTGFKGVKRIKATGKYSALLMLNGVTRRSACFCTAIGAALAYDAMAREFHGEFAAVNFPDLDVDWEWRPGSLSSAQPGFRAIREAA